MTDQVADRSPGSEYRTPETLITQTPENHESLFVRRLSPRVVLRVTAHGFRALLKVNSRDQYVCPREGRHSCEGHYAPTSAVEAVIAAAEYWQDPFTEAEQSRLRASLEGLEPVNAALARFRLQLKAGQQSPLPDWADPRWEDTARRLVRGS